VFAFIVLIGAGVAALGLLGERIGTGVIESIARLKRHPRRRGPARRSSRSRCSPAVRLATSARLGADHEFRVLFVFLSLGLNSGRFAGLLDLVTSLSTRWARTSTAARLAQLDSSGRSGDPSARGRVAASSEC